jgi:hypothetical protein
MPAEGNSAMLSRRHNTISHGFPDCLPVRVAIPAVVRGKDKPELGTAVGCVLHTDRAVVRFD